MAKKKVAFGGYAINFKGCDDTLESVMGSKPIGPSEMTSSMPSPSSAGVLFQAR